MLSAIFVDRPRLAIVIAVVDTTIAQPIEAQVVGVASTTKT